MEDPVVRIIITPLVQVIVTGDTVLSVQAAILLGQFLHLVSSLVPHEVRLYRVVIK